MARRSPRWLLLLLMLLSACRQVLALEHAELATDAGPAESKTPVHSKNGVPYVGIACEAPLETACVQCRQDRCGGADAQCLSNTKCRTQLDEYAICLAPKCDGDSENCLIEKINDPTLKQCLRMCGSACADTPLVSPCELYCACMQRCPPDQQKVLGDCMTTCEGWDPAIRSCRRDHCETALYVQKPSEIVEHCNHANGSAEGVCQDYQERPLSKRTVCLDKNESTWSCEHGSDCCSEVCHSGVCD